MKRAERSGGTRSGALSGGDEETCVTLTRDKAHRIALIEALSGDPRDNRPLIGGGVAGARPHVGRFASPRAPGERMRFTLRTAPRRARLPPLPFGSVSVCAVSGASYTSVLFPVLNAYKRARRPPAHVPFICQTGGTYARLDLFSACRACTTDGSTGRDELCFNDRTSGSHSTSGSLRSQLPHFRRLIHTNMK